jgi:hypothetical protein
VSNLPTRAPSDAATLTTAAYRELVAALSGRVLTAVQAVALRQILLQLHVVARLLDEADAPEAPASKQQDSYRGAVAMTAITAFRRELDDLVATDGPPEDEPFPAQLLAEVHGGAR